ncbi:STAS domain-containing protein [Kitasatospora sp. A2-31]|uniref:STAS domain-containing protein n=1 Tax=Kitasatospora sp. A2-31 TaxID=2916414 RepID=UPI001EE9DDFD|nr:STAS domain-containing protein [Kitasatospora sp. A2-31]MCG6493867.1 STAS domain-containing protein [Kitasatospora sp. A2-31]
MPKNEDRTTEPGDLTVSARPWSGGTVLTLRGELDLGSVDRLDSALDSALQTAGTTVVIDCGGLDFCDSTGLNAMLRGRAIADAGGSRIELVRPSPLVLRMLELTGAKDAFRIRDEPPD